MWGFSRFYHATGYYWNEGQYWWFALGAVSYVFFCYKMGVFKSTIFHLIAFPLILNRWYWMVDAFRLGERPADAVFQAVGTLIVAIILYVGFAFSLSKKTW